MIIALVMHRAIFGRGLIRTAVLIPYGIVTVVAAFAWFFAFDPSSGFVNGLPFIPDDQAWFGDRTDAFTVIILTEVWKTTPFMALLLLAGLATIDEGLYEAAKVDGANAVQRFVRIDRKSTRLNSSHANISYAVFCLKKKNKQYWLVYPNLSTECSRHL